MLHDRGSFAPKYPKSTAFLFAFVSFALLLVGCSRDPNVRKQKYLQTGEHYFENAKYSEAAIEFRDALKIDPNFAEAHYQLARADIQFQDWPHAYSELTRAVELQPENYQAQVELARLLIMSGNPQAAKDQTDLLLKKWPNNSQSHFMAANLLAAQNSFPAAIQEVQKAIALDANDSNLYLNLGLMQTRNNQSDAAEASFKKAIELNPKATNARMLLASYYQAHGRMPESEHELQSAIAADPQNPDPRAALARLYVAENRKPDAVNLLRQAKGDFPNTSAGYRMLGDFYFVSGDLDNALAEYADLNHAHPKDLQVKKNYIQLLILKNHDAEARTLDDEILKSDPNDNEGLIYRGQLQLRAGDAKSAIGTLQTAIKNNPNDAVAHYHLGAAYQSLGDLNGAESEWQQSLRLRPGQDQVVRALAGLAMRRGDMPLLAQTTTQMITLEPTSPEGYALRATAEINERKFDNAESDAHKAIEVAPQSAFGYVQMGNLKFAQNNYKEAAKYFQQALDRNADSTDALRGLMNTYFVQKQLPDAISAVKSQIAKSPKNSEFYDLLGVALSRNKGTASDAEAAFSKALELNPNNFDAVINLGETEAANGDIDKAVALFEQSVKDHPQQSPMYIFLGRLYEAKHDWKNAESTYQRALVVKPDDALAANNLANVLIAEGGNYDTALSLAQTARQGLPDSPAVADTLGWIYYQKGAYTSAVSLLQESVKLREKDKLPDNADVHYHLGLAYAKTDQRRLAREQLERVLKIDPNYGAAAEVKKELASLKS